MSKNEVNDIKRFKPSFQTGLTNEQVKNRIEQKLVNKTKIAVGKTAWEIIKTNVLSFFNIILFVMAGLMIFAENYTGLLFLTVLIPNIIIGLYQDFHARALMRKLRLITQPKATVIRDSYQLIIETKDVVLDDVLLLKSENQVCVDGVVLQGHVLVNESQITGEPQSIEKNVGDTVYSGSYIVSGSAYIRAEKIGEESYIQTIQSKANKFSRSPSEILRALRILFRVIGIIVAVVGITTISIYAVQGGFNDVVSIKKEIGPISGSLIAMIPSGLYLLTSLALAVAVIKLAKKNAQVQDFYSVEMLSRVDVLCVDKTGTITDGSMEVRKVDILNGQSQNEIAQVISNVLIATNDSNFTAKALRQKFTFELTKDIITVLPFNSDNKYSGATFKGGRTYIIGAAEYINLFNKPGIIRRTEQYTSKGERVLVLAEAREPIKDGRMIGNASAIALIVLQDHIRPDAIKTFAWFNENGVDIKVISGDNAMTTSEIAIQAGIKNADKYISLDNMPIEQVKLIANNYTVFGRVTPEQKEAIIESLKEQKHKVAMTGDGVNDILALKRADCSIAMASGSDAARNVSHIVLMDSNFDHLPDVVAEGRRVVNNLQRTSSLFLVKTLFAMFFSIMFLSLTIETWDKSIRYPFLPNKMMIWELFTIGVSSFFLALEPNKEQIKGTFVGNIAKKVVPGALMVILPTLLILVMMFIQKNGISFTGVYPDISSDGIHYLSSSVVASSMCTITFSALSLFYLLKICLPFTKYRAFVFIVCALLTVGAFVGTYFYSMNTGDANFFRVDYNSLGLMQYVIVLLAVFLSSSVYFLISYIVSLAKGDKDNVKD